VTSLGSSEIEVFVCSHSRDVDIGHYREMSQHVQCGLARWAYGRLDSHFKGRILSDRDIQALDKVFEAAKRMNCEVRVYDMSRMTERLKAWKRGILTTPSVVMNGVKYKGLDQVSQAIALG
jgi:hypothetical protein